ncbi:hypothetical protein HYH03_014421 [Edaphochlamys debaryana]|uniref:Peptidase M11 gametolysin domain-containing protein n=1 Tax=Edaphochlamys debaryana TaxID=47281 RepID=A0A835XP27_9CHLO|nr:hypothetical protein HYH03_014421 [Edaphochlamys debaryana]|eukprot:KAG2486922.1 hypothetical protein HYH03_014421 [Edaphochlamys debaryana]
MYLLLSGAPVDASGVPYKVGTTLELTCFLSQSVPFACTLTTNIRIPFLAAPAPSQNLKMKATVFLLSLGGSCTSGTVSSDYVLNAFWGTNGYASQMNKCSYGSVVYDRASFKVVPITLPCSASYVGNCSLREIANTAMTIASAQGVSTTADIFQLYVMPHLMNDRRCGNWVGLAYLTAKDTYYMPDDSGIGSTGTVMQEVIHNFGLYHGWSSTGAEYGDESTSMGRGDNCPSAPELWRLGWATPIDTLSSANFPENRYRKYLLPYTYAGPSGAYLKILADWVQYDKNVYLALRGRGGGDWSIQDGFVNRISVHVGNATVDNNFDDYDDPRYTILGTIGSNGFYDMTARRLAIKTQALSGGKMEVWVCRYSSSASQCVSPNQGTVCNPYSGYSVQADVDHAGDDIAVTGNATNALAACNADPSCKGFSLPNGVTKKAVSPVVASAGRCLYIKIETICAAFSGYTVQINMDHTGDDLQQTTSVTVAATACTANAACRGFNSNGVLKTTVSPASATYGTCLYTKVPAACKDFPGYTKQADVDHTGDNIVWKFTLSDAFEVCNLDPTCRGFNSLGYVKSDAIANTASSGMCLYTKLTNTVLDQAWCGSVQEKFSLLPRFSWGNTPSAYQDLWSQAGCEPEKICRYWYSTRGAIVCGFNLPATLRPSWRALNCDRILNLTQDPNFTQCPSIVGYNIKGNSDFVGNDIGRKDSLEEALKACNEDLTCKGFNSDGYYKTVVFPRVSAPCVCVYTKVNPVTVLDQDDCGAVQEKFGIIPRTTWGEATPAYQDLWKASACEPEKICRYWYKRWGVKPCVDYGSMPDNLQPAWQALNCDFYWNDFCPTIDLYTVAANVDHEYTGDNLPIKAPSAVEAARACTADLTCRGFNSDGWTKRILTPTAPSKCKCLYTKINFTTTLDSDGCGYVQEQFGIIPKSTWGNATQAYQSLWTANACEPEKICRYWYKRWGVQPCGGFGSMPANLQASWNALQCARYWTHCPAFSGYSVANHADHVSDDIGRRSTPAAAASACDIDVTCKGFNSDGYFKTVVAPASFALCKCLYTKQNVITVLDDYRCGMVQEQFGILPKVSWGNATDATRQIWTSSFCEPDKICRYWYSRWGVQPCVGYGSMPSNLYRSWDILNCNRFWNYCSDVSGYSVAGNVDHEGDDIPGSPRNGITATADACNADPTCKGFNSAGYFKTVVAPTAPAQCMCLYTKKNFITVLDQDGCGYVQEKFGIIPFTTWGNATGATQQLWAASACDPEKICRYWYSRWGVSPCASYGSMPDNLRGAWDRFNCNQYWNFCPYFSGYTVQGNADHEGDDIQRRGTTVDAAIACSADLTCKGFNSDGFYKTAVAPAGFAQCKCLYTKQNALLDQAGCGYVQEQYGIIPFNTWGTATQAYQDLWTASACEPEKICRYWYTRWGVSPCTSYGSMPDNLRGAWDRLNCNQYWNDYCPAFSGYTAAGSVDHEGNDIDPRRDSPAAAAAACDADLTCKGFNSDGWTKTVVAPTARSSPLCKCLYIKQNPVTVLDNNGCGAVQEQYGIIPLSSWGTAPQRYQDLWTSSGCEPYKICVYWNYRWNVQPCVSYGSLPSNLYRSWDALRCNGYWAYCPNWSG